MDVVIEPRDGVSDAELAVYAADVNSALPGAPITINGVEAGVVDDPQFVFTDGTNTRNCEC